MSDTKRVALHAAPSRTQHAVFRLLRDRDDVEMVGVDDDPALIIYVGPLDQSPYSGCDSNVREFPSSESRQSARLKTINALRAMDESESHGGKGTYAEAVKDG